MKDFLDTHGLLPEYKPATELYIALTDIKLREEARELLSDLQIEGVNVAIDWSERKIGDQLKTADKQKVPFILVFGEDEVKTGMYKIKNMKTGEEKTVKKEEIKECVK